MTSNAGKPITIYNIAELAAKAYIEAFNKANLIKGFEKTGIWPLNVFTEDDFLMAAVTDRRLENCESIPKDLHGNEFTTPKIPPPSTSKQV